MALALLQFLSRVTFQSVDVGDNAMGADAPADYINRDRICFIILNAVRESGMSMTDCFR